MKPIRIDRFTEKCPKCGEKVMYAVGTGTIFHGASESYEDTNYTEGYSIAMWSRANGVRDAIVEVYDAPTIDAVEVVHGEWKPNPKIGWGETWVCSICGEKTTSSVMGYPRYRYCPMCGVKMKGADDE